MIGTRAFTISANIILLLACTVVPIGAAPGIPTRTEMSWQGPDGTTGQPTNPGTALMGTLPSALFLQNQGQWDPQVRFQARGPREVTWFTDDAIWFTIPERAPQRSSTLPALASDPVLPSTGPQRGVNLKVTFTGLNANAHLVGAKPQASRVNFLTGQQPSNWHVNIPTYSSVRWENVYPGITFIFNGPSWTVETVPGADLSALRLHIEGADQLRIADDGRLLADTQAGEIPLPGLQLADGSPLQPLPSGNTTRFTRGAISNPLSDLHGPRPGWRAPSSLILDPYNDPTDLVYSTFLGGTGDDGDYCRITIGSDGSTYIIGNTSSYDFPATPGTFDTSYNGSWDVYVSKLNPSGSTILYSSFLGGSSTDTGYSIAVDPSGAAYVTGSTSSSDFPTTPGAFSTSFHGASDAFVTKLDPTGNTVAYSTFLGGSDSDTSFDIAVDANGFAYAAGWTHSGNFPTTIGSFSPAFNGGTLDAFVTKVDPSGTSLVYSTFLGGSGDEGAHGIVVDGTGAAYISGNTTSANFPTTSGAFDTTYNGGGDDFITKLTESGTSLVYSTFLGGSASEPGATLAIDSSGAAYITDQTSSTIFPVTPGAYDTTFNGSADAFVAKLNPDGSTLAYSTYIGGASSDKGYEIAVDPSGEAYITGQTYSGNYPTTPGAFNTRYGDSMHEDGFLTKLSGSGSSVVYSTFLGTNGNDIGLGIAVDGDGFAYVSGLTDSAAFPTTSGAFDTTFNGVYDTFVSKLSPDLTSPVLHVASIDPFYQPVGNRYQIGTSVTIRDTNNNPVSSAVVTLQVTKPSGQTLVITLLTNNLGTGVIAGFTSQPGTYTFTVVNIAKPGWTYDPSQNIETTDSVTIP